MEPFKSKSIVLFSSSLSLSPPSFFFFLVSSFFLTVFAGMGGKRRDL